MAKFQNLNKDFINKAQRITSFNVKDKDFTDLTYKEEMQFLYSSHFFKNFDFNKALNTGALGVTQIKQINSLCVLLKRDNPTGYKDLVAFTGQALGPGEVLLYLLHDKLISK